MNLKRPFLSIAILVFAVCLKAKPAHELNFKISVADGLEEEFQTKGRLFIFLSENSHGQPMNQLWPVSAMRNNIFAKNFEAWKPGETLEIKAGSDFVRTCLFDFDRVPAGTYSIQALWDQNNEESSINASGNLHSRTQSIEITADKTITLELDQAIKARKLIEHEFVKLVDFKSDTLSTWWKKTVSLKASVLLPSGYFENPEKRYPVRYNVAGYGGRYHRVNRLLSGQGDFNAWWFSEDAPQIVNVFLDGEGPFGDSYQLDSENSGPYGHALIHELIPYIEEKFRGLGTPETRFVDGCSTGGWVSLALQIIYPDFFNGAYSYSPDAIEFENYQTINIYKDKNAFYNEWGNPRPSARDITGDPITMMKEFVQYENVQGSSNTYLNSGGQMSAHSALYSPKGENGLPAPLFDPFTGEIDQTIAEHWKKYDLKIILQDNWSNLGPKLQGKLWIWMGDMDNFILNPATRAFHEYLLTTENPSSDAEIIFEPMQGHCWKFSHKEILKMISEKLKNESIKSN